MILSTTMRTDTPTMKPMVRPMPRLSRKTWKKVASTKGTSCPWHKTTLQPALTHIRNSTKSFLVKITNFQSLKFKRPKFEFESTKSQSDSLLDCTSYELYDIFCSATCYPKFFAIRANMAFIREIETWHLYGGPLPQLYNRSPLAK